MQARSITYELCTSTIDAVQLAQNYQLHGIELCNVLSIGGISPSLSFLKQSRDIFKGEISVLIRPRPGNFVYNSPEKTLILDEIQLFVDCGMDTIVFGCLDEQNQVDFDFLSIIKSKAPICKLCFHRAFDDISDQSSALESLIDFGIDRVLTSGGKQSAHLGAEKLKQHIVQANGRIEVMPGAGVNASNIQEILRTTGAKRIHFSLTQRLKNYESIMDLGEISQIQKAELEKLLEIQLELAQN